MLHATVKRFELWLRGLPQTLICKLAGIGSTLRIGLAAAVINAVNLPYDPTPMKDLGLRT